MRPKDKGESTFQTYLHEINKIDLLTAEEEKELAARIAGGDNDAREKMIRANLRLVVNIAKNYARKGLSLMDLIEEGNLGLLRAVQGFDPSQGNRFSTYASWWIRQSIKRALVNKVKTIRIPAYMVELVARWKNASVDLTNRLNRPPTFEEIAEELNLPAEKIQIIKRAISSVSTGSQDTSDGTSYSLVDMLKDEKTKSPPEELFDSYERDLIEQMLDAIDHRESAGPAYALRHRGRRAHDAQGNRAKIGPHPGAYHA
ncbi:unnamed protein product, partial [marine sediment metagenome]